MASKIPSKTRAKFTDEQGRYRLQYANLTRQAARARSTQLIRSGMANRPVTSQEGGASLKNGILAMGRRGHVDAETMQKLENMDEDKLANLYNNNDFVFEVYFQYDTVIHTKDREIIVTEGGKQRDADFLIEQYEKVYNTRL